MDYRVITIGALSCHELWGEKAATRTPHATTTLIRSGSQVVLVDPGLPPEVIARRLPERSGVHVDQVTDIFLTNFRPAHRRGITAFPNANWYISEMEREAIGQRLVQRLQSEQDPDVKRMLEQDIGILKRCKSAPDRVAPQVDLFPLSGYTPGTCGLLLCSINSTTLVAGDAVATIEHLERGQILGGAFEVDQARESFVEALEIADVIIPGHDNLVLNPARRAV